MHPKGPSVCSYQSSQMCVPQQCSQIAAYFYIISLAPSSSTLVTCTSTPKRRERESISIWGLSKALIESFFVMGQSKDAHHKRKQNLNFGVLTTNYMSHTLLYYWMLYKTIFFLTNPEF
jgi:hypothetical protein